MHCLLSLFTVIAVLCNITQQSPRPNYMGSHMNLSSHSNLKPRTIDRINHNNDMETTSRTHLWRKEFMIIYDMNHRPDFKITSYPKNTGPSVIQIRELLPSPKLLH